MHFSFGYLYIMDLINARKIEHIKIYTFHYVTYINMFMIW